MGQRALTVTVTLTLFALILPPRSDAIPAFARRYRVSCQLCHDPIPKLTPFGETFAANGYRFAPGEEPTDTIGTGDPNLVLLETLPLAVRLDAYAQWFAKGQAATDFETPYGLKLLSGGPISKSVSFYFYTFLAERGEVAGVEDASLIFNDLDGRSLDLQVGQFQVSDALFKRELRLEFEDYAVYRARVGEVPVDLTYDRGILASIDLQGVDLTAQILNGNGIGPAQSDRRFDNDGYKNLFLRVGRSLGSSAQLGAMGYVGRSTSEGVRNETTMWGVDGSLAIGPIEINAQFVHRRDDRPTYQLGESSIELDGGFLEAIVRPPGSRWYGFGLYNLVDADRPLLNVRLGGPADVPRYQTVSSGIGYRLRTNLRWTMEGTWDTERDRLRLTSGLVSAF